MTRRRWIADEVHADRALLLGQNAQHLVRVLRAQVGQEFDVAADGQVRVGKIVSIDDNRVEFELSEAVAAGPALDLTLLVSSLQVRPDGVGDRESDGTRSRKDRAHRCATD